MPPRRIKADHPLVRGCGTPKPCAATWALRLNVWHSIRNLAARYRSLPDNHRLARAAEKEERVEKWGGFWGRPVASWSGCQDPARVQMARIGCRVGVLCTMKV